MVIDPRHQFHTSQSRYFNPAFTLLRSLGRHSLIRCKHLRRAGILGFRYFIRKDGIIILAGRFCSFWIIFTER
jgi:hypothetical protein